VANSILADATGGTGTFFSNLTGLVPGTTYHLRAYAHNSVGYAYGSDVTFTPSNLATVTTDPMGSLVGAVAEGNYTVVSEGAGGITAVGLVWGTTVNPTITTNTGILTDPNYWPGSTGMSFPLDLTGLTVNTLYHVRAYATNSSGTAYGADVTFTATPAVLGQMVQLNYNSGYVFSLDATGTHGLIAMTYNLGTSDWGCTNTPVTTGTAVGTGSANTDAINLNISTNACMSAAMNMGFASQLTKMYGVEWFLPSKDELNLLWTNRTADASGALAAALSSAIGFAPIWSSSQVDNTHAWSFNGTMVSTGLKTGQYYVWPVRAF
jgi:hypothetical protein